MKAAVYCGTRNVYADMVTAAKSLLYNSNVDKIYFLIEDDEFAYELPPQIEAINVSNQPYFKKDSPNYDCGWTYMVLMKAAMHRVFPKLDRILCLDIDTIVDKDISELWDLDLNRYYLAAAKEPRASEERGVLYVNAGVMMLNLNNLRLLGKGDELIAVLNRKKFLWCEQDCISERCQDGILEISGDYNACNYTIHSDDPKIVHFAAVKNWRKNTRAKYYKKLTKYRKMSWEDVCKS